MISKEQNYSYELITLSDKLGYKYITLMWIKQMEKMWENAKKKKKKYLSYRILYKYTEFTIYNEPIIYVL